MNHWIEFVLYPGALGLDIAGPLEEVAALSGFADGEQLRRAVPRRFGETPSQYRGRMRSA